MNNVQVSSAVPGARRLTKHSSGCPCQPVWARTTTPCQSLFEMQVSDLCATDLTQANQSQCFMMGFILQLTGLQSSPSGSSESTTENKSKHCVPFYLAVDMRKKKIRIAMINFSLIFLRRNQSKSLSTNPGLHFLRGLIKHVCTTLFIYSFVQTQNLKS